MKRVTFILLALASLPATPALSAPTSEQAVEEHLARGVALRRQGQTEQALVEFQRAHATAPSGRTFAQMGLAEQALKRWTDAEQHLASALEDPSSWIQKNRAALSESLAKVRQHIGTLDLRGPVGARVSINGRDVGVLPLSQPLRLGEGEISIVVTASGRRDFTQWMTIRGQERHSITAELQPVMAVAPEDAGKAVTGPLANMPAPGDGERHRWTGTRLVGVGLLTAGIAAVGVGAALYFLDGKETCSNQPGFGCDRARTSKTPAVMIGGAGITSGIAGAWFLLRQSDGAASVALSPHMVGAAYSGRF